jgi:predicted ATP-grasp superfamily ATP-dependent carboligase
VKAGEALTIKFDKFEKLAKDYANNLTEIAKAIHAETEKETSQRGK